MSSNQAKFNRVAVLMGGISSEREISLKTGRAVASSLRRTGRDVFEFGVTPNLGVNLLDTGIEAVFICLHGRYGEDGTVQGLLELLNIPYTGSGVMASSIALDKSISKELFKSKGILVPAGFTVKGFPGEDEISSIEIPAVIKPSREGSTVGVSIVTKAEELDGAFRKALEYDDEILVEEYIEGREMTVTIVGEKPRALPIVEIISEIGFYDYYAKYVTGKTKYCVPAELNEREAEFIKESSLAAYEAIKCSGLARVDLIYKEERAYFLEVNTIPGMTESSLAPKAAAAVGISFDQLVDEVMESARIHL